MRSFCLAFFIFLIQIPSLASATLSCSERLEDRLQNLPSWMTTSPVLSKDDVDQDCIFRAMETFYDWTEHVRLTRKENGQSEKGHYVYCANDRERTYRSKLPPCPSDRYLNTITNTYNTTLKCFGFSPKDMFAITAVESGFQINTLSTKGVDIGLGQLTPIAVEDINPHWEEYKDKLLGNSDPKCEMLKQQVQSMRPADLQNLTCDLTDLPENPLRNIVYLAFLHFKNSSYLIKELEHNSLFRKIEILIGRTLSSTEKQRFLNMLLAMSYNTGSDEAIGALRSYINHRQAGLPNFTEQIEILENQKVLFYLQAQDYMGRGFNDEGYSLMYRRNQIINQIAELEQQAATVKIPLNDFAITSYKNSFGSFLKSSGSSQYLDVLQRRIRSVESSIKRKGQCATGNYLENLQD